MYPPTEFQLLEENLNHYKCWEASDPESHAVAIRLNADQMATFDELQTTYAELFKQMHEQFKQRLNASRDNFKPLG